MEKTLKDLNETWKGTPFEKKRFLDTYDNEFFKFKDKLDLRILELGVDKGGSLELWESYFSNLSLLVGVEKNDWKIEGNFSYKTRIEIGDLSQTEFYDRIKRYGSFDIIIDDASHKASDIILSFNNLFPILSDGGIYCIENVYYSGTGEYNNQHLEKFIQELIIDANGITDCLQIPERMNQFSWWIKSVHIENQLIIVRKGLWNYEQRHSGCR
jgi:hypothetical protein